MWLLLTGRRLCAGPLAPAVGRFLCGLCAVGVWPAATLGADILRRMSAPFCPMTEGAMRCRGRSVSIPCQGIATRRCGGCCERGGDGRPNGGAGNCGRCAVPVLSELSDQLSGWCALLAIVCFGLLCGWLMSDAD